MRKYLIHLLPLIYFITGITSCKKEISLPEEKTFVQPVIQNSAPKVYAGGDLKIELPQNFYVLKGSFSNADGNFKKTEWRKLSGPDSCIIVDKDSLITEVSNLSEGVYEFELTVTDKMNFFGKDSVKVEVVKLEQVSLEHEIIFKNLVWIFPWYAALEVNNIYTFIPTSSAIKVFIQRDNASVWTEATPVSNNGNSSAYEYFIETRLPNGAGMYNHGSLYIFYYGMGTNDAPAVKIKF